MIKKILISEEDKKSISKNLIRRDSDLEKTDFSGEVVNKPWGYEYLMFQNHDVSIWMLYIKKGYCTSTHCHPNKKTSLLLISGEAICSTLNEKFSLKEKDGLIFDRGVFHKTEAISENGIFVMEIETPHDKMDLFRLRDDYKREMKGYTDKKNVTDKIYNYHYLLLEDKKDSSAILGKYKFLLKEYTIKEEVLRDIEVLKPCSSILISGFIKLEDYDKTSGDLIDIEELESCTFDSKIRVLFLHERKNLIKLSDYIVSFLQKKEINDIFLVSGSNLMHLLESIRLEDINYICTHHEQAAAMAADGYARVKNKTGLVIVAGGAGAINAITGVAGAWIDSVPLIVISGQGYDDQTVGNSGLRQLGVQETDIINIVKPITKYAVMLKNPRMIKYHLEKAFYLAQSGRPGPVWIDVPVNFQMTMIQEEELESFKIPENEEKDYLELKKSVKKTIDLLNRAERPVVVAGHGIRLAHAENKFLELADFLSVPVLTTRNGNDLIANDNPLYAGRPGSFGQRAANFTIQNSDLLLSIGSRLSLAVTGWAYRDFARKAKKIVVDIDSLELKKPTIHFNLAIKSDAKDFILEMLNQKDSYKKQDLSEWKDKIKHWKEKYPVVLPEYREEKDFVNSYYFIDVLSDELKGEDVIVTDTGMSFQCTMQAFKLKKGQRLFTAAGLAAMGYGLPGAIGACIGNDKKRTICISGDGGLQRNIQELQTIKHNNLPIKLFIFNNKGYTSMREIQKDYFKGYIASESTSGVSIPNLLKVVEAYGIKIIRIDNHKNLREKIREVLGYEGPVVCDLNISEFQGIKPKQGAFNRPDGKTVPRPIEDMRPYINRENLEEDMIIDPVPFDPYKE